MNSKDALKFELSRLFTRFDFEEVIQSMNDILKEAESATQTDVDQLSDELDVECAKENLKAIKRIRMHFKNVIGLAESSNLCL